MLVDKTTLRHPAGGRQNSLVLGIRGKVAIQRSDTYVRAKRKVRQELFHLPDVSGSRKKDQEATLFGLQQTVNGVCHLRGENLFAPVSRYSGFR